MYTIDFSKPTSVHFIGIGGISMSGLAEILLKEGFRVSGSDSKESPLTQHLTELGAQIAYPQAAANTRTIPRSSSTRLPSIRTIRSSSAPRN